MQSPTHWTTREFPGEIFVTLWWGSGMLQLASSGLKLGMLFNIL